MRIAQRDMETEREREREEESEMYEEGHTLPKEGVKEGK